MLRKIALWLLDQLYSSLDGDVKTAVDDFKAKQADAEQSVVEANAALVLTRQREADLSAELRGVQADLKSTQTALLAATAGFAQARDDLARLNAAEAQIRADADTKRKALDAMDDGTALREADI